MEAMNSPSVGDLLHKKRKCKHGKVRRGKRKGQCLKHKRARKHRRKR